MVSVGMCTINIKLNIEGITHLDDFEEFNCCIDELNMANANLNSSLSFIEKHVVQYIGFNVQHITYAFTCTFHARGKYKNHSSVDHATNTCS